MADYSEDLGFIEELYRSTKDSANEKTDKDKGADISGETDDLEGLTTAYNILSDTANSPFGEDRDLGEVADATTIFPELKSLLARSGRTSNSKLMAPVVEALDAYLEEDGVTIKTRDYHIAKHSAGNDANATEAAKDAAAEDAFADAIMQILVKMRNFIVAAEDYLDQKDSGSKPWTDAGKQRIALVRAAKIQMEDQEKQFAANSEKLRNKMKTLLDKTEENGLSRLNMSVHVMVSDLLTEERDERNRKEIESMADEIATRILMDSAVSQNDTNTQDVSFVADIFNMGRSVEDKEIYDPATMLSTYTQLRSEKPNAFATSASAVDNLVYGKIKDVLDDTDNIRKQKAGICAMFYLMTGKIDMPEFIYYFEVKPDQSGMEEGQTVEFIRAFPTTVPVLEKNGQGNVEKTAEIFVEKIRQQCGDDALASVDYMKYIGGQATENAQLLKPDDEFWTDLGEALKKSRKKEEQKEVLSLVNDLQLRYLGLQKALGQLGPLPKPAPAKAPAEVPAEAQAEVPAEAPAKTTGNENG